MSNVRPGDLAQIVKAAGGFQWTLGRVVKIQEACWCASVDDSCWRFEDELTQDGRITVTCAFDNCLKRIPPLDEPDAKARPRKVEQV